MDFDLIMALMARNVIFEFKLLPKSALKVTA